ncbi:OPT oligopeptide transporter protein-domain-containing protein [Lactarius quietus]|nr:OPT oligopeptide transporter protein-domain-containing protein [Lactarius quietus]
MSSSDDKGSGDLERHGSGHLFDSLGAITDSDDDPNFDLTAIIMEDESPYPEVRSAVSNTDDPMMPVSTLCAWVLGIIWTAFIPGINQFFYFRYPYMVIEGFIPLFVSFPIGKLWARYVPNATLFGVELNPSPFTIKEHVIITAMSLVAGEAAYAVDRHFAVQKVFYNQSPSFAYQWLLVMSTQLIGYLIGGISKRIIVDPPSMIWPENLVFGALFNTIHSLESSGSRGLGGISRKRFSRDLPLPVTCPVTARGARSARRRRSLPGSGRPIWPRLAKRASNVLPRHSAVARVQSEWGSRSIGVAGLVALTRSSGVCPTVVASAPRPY